MAKRSMLFFLMVPVLKLKSLNRLIRVMALTVCGVSLAIVKYYSVIYITFKSQIQKTFRKFFAGCKIKSELTFQSIKYKRNTRGQIEYAT